MNYQLSLHFFTMERRWPAVLANCIMDLVKNLFISYMVFVSDVPKLSIASHLKGLCLLSGFAVQCPALTCK